MYDNKVFERILSFDGNCYYKVCCCQKFIQVKLDLLLEENDENKKTALNHDIANLIEIYLPALKITISPLGWYEPDQILEDVNVCLRLSEINSQWQSKLIFIAYDLIEILAPFTDFTTEINSAKTEWWTAFGKIKGTLNNSL